MPGELSDLPATRQTSTGTEKANALIHLVQVFFGFLRTDELDILGAVLPDGSELGAPLLHEILL